MLCFEKNIIPISRSTGLTHLAPADSCWPLSLPSVLLSSSYTSLSSISWKCQAILYLKIITFPSDQNILGQVICLSPQPSDLGISSEKISLTSSLPMWLTPPSFPPQFCSLSLQHCFFFFFIHSPCHLAVFASRLLASQAQGSHQFYIPVYLQCLSQSLAYSKYLNICWVNWISLHWVKRIQDPGIVFLFQMQ